MNQSIDLRRGKTCVFLMHVHLGFVTKYRRKVFSKQILADLKEIFTSVCFDFESRLIELEGEEDHVHLLILQNTDECAIHLGLERPSVLASTG